MRRIRVTAAVGICAAFGFLAACGANDEPVSLGPVPSGAATTELVATVPAPTATITQEAGAKVTYEVWFTRVETEGRETEPHLFVVHRTQPATRAVGAAALEALLAGPSDQEVNGDVATAVPAGTELLGLDIADGVATVDLSSEFEAGGGSRSIRLRLAQVVFTLTQFPTVKRVLFRLDGEPVDVFSGEGLVLDEPVTRADYDELVPTILVESPPVWAEVGNPVTVSGSANVFEANVTVRVLLWNGKEIAREFTTATCGSGCRGDFSVSVEYPPQKEETAVIVVHDDDAVGEGFPPHEIRIPVILKTRG